MRKTPAIPMCNILARSHRSNKRCPDSDLWLAKVKSKKASFSLSFALQPVPRPNFILLFRPAEHKVYLHDIFEPFLLLWLLELGVKAVEGQFGEALALLGVHLSTHQRLCLDRV